MTNWKMVKLSTLCSRIGDGLHGTPKYVDYGNVFFINGNNLKEGKIEINDDTKRVSEDDLKMNFIPLGSFSLLIGINGTIGNMAFYNGQKLMLGKSAAYLNFKSEINRFYYFYFQLPRVQKHFYDIATGSTIKNLSLRSLNDFEVPIPNDDEGNKIVSVLSSLDNKIDLNNQINDNLERMGKTLYDYWFVQFDFPDENGKPYKSSGGKMVWNETLRREIPKGWEVSKLGKVLKTYLGGTPSTKNEKYWKGDIPWMNSGEVANFPIISTEQKITQEAINNSSTRKLKEGSVLLSITRYLRVNILGIEACINQSIVGIEENQFFKKSYIYYSILNDIERLMSLRTGAQQPHINKEIVDSSPIIVPVESVIINYTKKSSLVLDRIINNARQNQQLSQLRDWLLPMLMNGQVIVE